MRFLKSWVPVLLMLSAEACTSKVTQSPKQEGAIVTPTAVQNNAAAKTLPPFAIVDVAGNVKNLQDFKGKKLFVNLWATWCPPCRAEMPSIAKLHKVADKENTQFVLLSLDKDFETAKKYVQANKLDVPIFFPAGDVPDLFLVEGIPTTFIFDEQGQLVAQHEGSEDYNTPGYRNLFGPAK